MGLSIIQKIIRDHIVEGEETPGAPVGIRIDQTLTQDATGTMAYLQFEALDIPRVRTGLSVSYIDHNTLQMGFENADDHRYLQSVAAKYGILLSKPGNGICHQVHLERFALPGKTLLGSDSHTPTGGGIGSMAIGAGGLDVAAAMAGQPFFITYPKIVRVELTGRLRPWVAAKDVILALLEIMTTKGNVGCVVEYGGPGVETLSVPERATITNMGAELGVTTSVFPSDEITREFLEAQDRVDGWISLQADLDAEYKQVIEIDLSKLVPMVAKPHSPDNVCRIEDIAGMKVDQVAIGSCTNSSFKDLMTTAAALDGRTVDSEVSFIVAPGSKQAFSMISDNGALSKIIAAGARIMESTCGFCIGCGQAPQTDAVSVRTNNRNFFGRSGTASAGIYLVSPETAVACALTGKITDPRGLGIEYPNIKQPAHFKIDDSLIIPPSDEPEKIEVFRGPNIGDPPKNDPLPANISGPVAIRVGDKITTDHIMPAGQRLKYRSNTEKYATFVFEPLDETFSKRAAENRDSGLHNIIVAGLSYGQGSSREHAALCPMFLGVKAVIAKSIERIHSANLVNFGILPLYFVDEADYDRIEPGDDLEIANIREKLENGKHIAVLDKTGGFKFNVKHALSAKDVKTILAGGKLNYIKAKR